MLSSVRTLTMLLPVAILAAAASAQEARVAIPCDKVTPVLGNNSAVTQASNAAMHLDVFLAGYKKLDVDNFLNAVNTPGNPLYHHYLKGNEFATRFGGGMANAAPVIAYLVQQGFTNVRLDNTGLYVKADAPRSAVESAFQVKISTFVRPASQIGHTSVKANPTYFAPNTAPTLPASIASKVSAVYGLASYMVADSQIKASANTTFLGPTQIGNAYKNNVLHSAGFHGEGMTVCVISPTLWTNSDAQGYANHYGLGTVTVHDTPVDGGATVDAGSVEASLDACMIVGMAPKATVDMMMSPVTSSTGTYAQWFDMYSDSATLDPQVISSSWSLGEAVNDFPNTSNGLAAAYDAVFAAVAAKGIPIFNAAGDSGAFDRGSPGTVDMPFEDGVTTVTVVGGTALVDNGNGTFTEGPWTYNPVNNEGSGGGIDFIKARPSWQVGPHVINADSNGNRQFPDIAAVADPATSVEICYQGGFGGVGGTSAAAPISAGNFALITQAYGQRLGSNLNQMLYQLGQPQGLSDSYTGVHYTYNDIVGGSNGVEPSAGDAAIYNNLAWDYVTGWGSIDYSKMLNNLGALEGIASRNIDFAPYSPGFAFAGQTWTRPMDFTTTAVGPTGDDGAQFHATDTVHVHFAYQNQGSADALPMVIGVFVDNALVANHRVKAVPAATVEEYLNVASLSGLSLGVHTVRVVMDYGNTVPDSNAANNSYSRSIRIVP